ncbi:MAG: hypothetical protein KTR24_02400 [Saprospiraceae bacterium]|nr:hypothetical protein [Saprospiraceae bacterium]
MSFLIVLLSICTMSSSAGLDLDWAQPEGIWEWTFDNPDGTKMEGLMTVTKEGESYRIVMSGADGEYPLKEVEVEGNELKAGHIYFQGMKVDFKGTFLEKDFKGHITVDYNDFPFNAVRQK